VNETEWMDSVCDWLSASLAIMYPGSHMKASCHKRLPYRLEIRSYNRDDTPNAANPAHYQTDLCIFEITADGSWTPRVVIEGKLGAVTSHDALTYSGKGRDAHPGVPLPAVRDLDRRASFRAAAPVSSWKPLRFHDHLGRGAAGFK
jgi:hypothetical protein